MKQFIKKIFAKPEIDNTKYFRHFVLCSKKTYDSKVFNIMRDCLIMWSDQQSNSIDISGKCPITFYAREIDNTLWFYVILSLDQAKLWNVDEYHINIKDQSEINPLSIFDFDDYYKLFVENSHPLYK